MWITNLGWLTDGGLQKIRPLEGLDAMLLSGYLILAVGLLVLGCHCAVVAAARSRLFSDPQQLPHTEVGLVLGCAPTVAGGRPNRYFVARMDAAAALFRSGAAPVLLCSGSVSEGVADEPASMREALLERGVPDEAIVLDRMGNRTLDSIVRAQEVFGYSRLTLVSQRFHNQRGVFIGRHLGLEAFGLDARAVRGPNALKTELREVIARMRMLFDLYVLRIAARVNKHK